MIDSHIHLDAPQYADVDQLIKQAQAAGVIALIAPGVGSASNDAVMELSRKFPGIVFSALGLHPELELSDSDVEATIENVRSAREAISAIGEVGLPYYGDQDRIFATMPRAKRILARFAELATTLDLPLILHAPHLAARAALEIVRDAGVRGAVFHWHKSDPVTTESILKSGYLISLTPEVVYRERDQELARVVPLEQMLVETDGPWPYQGPFEGLPTVPAMLKETCAAIAHLKKLSPQRVIDATVANAKALFSLP
jgi:TatD DNase family protein